MTDDEPKFKFLLRYTHRSDDPYYYTNWSHGSTIEVVATDKDTAMKMADAALGDAGSHRYWVFRVLSVEQV